MRFTSRQAEILALIARGYPDKLIARELAMSKRTVRTHLERLFLVHGWHSRAEAAVAWAVCSQSSADGAGQNSARWTRSASSSPGEEGLRRPVPAD